MTLTVSMQTPTRIKALPVIRRPTDAPRDREPSITLGNSLRGHESHKLMVILWRCNPYYTSTQVHPSHISYAYLYELHLPYPVPLHRLRLGGQSALGTVRQCSCYTLFLQLYLTSRCVALLHSPLVTHSPILTLNMIHLRCGLTSSC